MMLVRRFLFVASLAIASAGMISMPASQAQAQVTGQDLIDLLDIGLADLNAELAQVQADLTAAQDAMPPDFTLIAALVAEQQELLFLINQYEATQDFANFYDQNALNILFAFYSNIISPATPSSA